MPPGVETMKHGSGFPMNMFKMPLKKETRSQEVSWKSRRKFKRLIEISKSTLLMVQSLKMEIKLKAGLQGQCDNACPVLIRPRDLVQRHPTRALGHVENRFPNVPALHVVLQLPAGIPIELVSAPGASGQTSKGKSLKVISLWFSQSLPWFCISKVSKKEMSNQNI